MKLQWVKTEWEVVGEGEREKKKISELTERDRVLDRSGSGVG
jgi:hypothetical protein